MAKNIITVLKDSTVKRIIWITGMGIHHEIKGIRGKMLGILAKTRPEYIKAIAKCMADMILDESLGVNDSLGITN